MAELEERGATAPVVLPAALLALGSAGLLLALLPVLGGRDVPARDLVLLAATPAVVHSVLGLLAGLLLRLAPPRARGLLLGGLALAAAAAVVRGAALAWPDLRPGEGRPIAAGATAVLAAAALALALATRRPGRARRAAAIALLLVPPVALAAALLLPADAWRAEAAPPPAFTVEETGHRILVVGIDGADWELLEPLLAAGRLPHLARLRAAGVWGSLATVRPALSPRIWTTVATGVEPERHGVRSFFRTFAGPLETPLEELRLPRQTGLQTAAGLLYRLHSLDGTGPVRMRFVDGTRRRVDALWNILARAGRPVAVVNWWATWPADPVAGAVVSDRVPFVPDAPRPLARLTYPEGLFGALRGCFVDPRDVPPEVYRRFMDVTDDEIAAMKRLRRGPVATPPSELPCFYAQDECARRCTRVALDAVPDAVLALTYFRAVDRACHVGMAYLPEQRDPTVTPEDVRRFGRLVPAAYAWADEILGELAARAVASGMSVLLLSDHGFRREGDGVYSHLGGPPGILVASGPAFAAGGRRVDGLSVRDVAPTILHALGFPVARDMTGRVATEILVDPARPVRAISTYGRTRPDAAPPGAGDETAIRDQLRGLGYLR